jgi:hypothetical protein
MPTQQDLQRNDKTWQIHSCEIISIREW